MSDDQQSSNDQSSNDETLESVLSDFAIPAAPNLGQRILRFIRREPLGFVSGLIIAGLIFMSAAAPILNTTDPSAFSTDVLKGPSSEHYFGTNRQGRDLWSRVLYGGRVSLKVGVATVIISIIAATILALLAGFFGGFVDFLLGRLADVFIAFPAIILALTFRASLKGTIPDLGVIMSSGELLVTIAIAIPFIPGIFRIMRGAVLEQRSSVYVEAAEASGATSLRVMFRHILPNITALVIVLTTTSLPAAILAESGLSFLGVGVPIEIPSWGAELSGQSRAFFQKAPWLAIFPGIALSLTVFAFNILGDALRDTLDPRLRGRI